MFNLYKIFKHSIVVLLWAPFHFASPVNEMAVDAVGSTLTSVPHPSELVDMVDPQSSSFRKYTGINWLHKLSDPVKSHSVAFFSEFFGTFLFLSMAFLVTTGVQNLQGYEGQLDAQTLLVISLSFGCALAVSVWLYGSSHFNMAVTMSQLLLRIIGPIRAIILFLAQIGGGLSASALTKAVYGKALVITDLNKVNELQGLLVESLGVTALVFTVLMMSVRKHNSTQFTPIAVGTILTVLVLLGAPITGGSFNYFRSLTPSIVEANFSKSHWIYFVSNVLGAGISTGLYRLIEEMQRSNAIVSDVEPSFGLGLAAGGQEIVLQADSRRARRNTVVSQPSAD